MKKAILILAGVAIGLSVGLFKMSAQSYPYWDAPASLTAMDGNDAYALPLAIVASTNALFGFDEDAPGGVVDVARWTECGGWEDLGGLLVNGWPSPHIQGFVHMPLVMTLHDHYLYVVGFFDLAAYTNSVNSSDLIYYEDGAPYTNDVQIAKFDLDTGVWTPLGQNFSARNITTPTTIAIDASNRIYVGFELDDPVDGNGNPISLNGTTVDMLDVSTNDGASWQEVGGGLVADSVITVADISALYADGTNLYIGGEFSGPTGINSTNVVIWTGNSWRATDGINSSYYTDLGSPNSGIDVVNSIVSIGTSIYVAGGFSSPQQGLARFSSVTGQSLPVGDPANYLSWVTGFYGNRGVSLALNNGNLYLGGLGAGVAGVNPYLVASLSDPTGSDPTSWMNLTTGSIDGDGSLGNWFLASATNGNAVYTLGSYDGGIPNGFARWLIGPDGPAPDASIIDVAWTNGIAGSTLTIYGTAGSHWQVIASTDLANWSPVGAVTLWGGSATFVDPSSYTSQPYYQLTNFCSQSDIAPQSFVDTGSLNTPREDATATLLTNSEVLVAGGENDSGLAISSAELYNPATGTWAATGSLNDARVSATATLLPNGQVLVAGGGSPFLGARSSAELYNPVTGTWTLTGSLNNGRIHATATLLPNGQVLVAGGNDGDGNPISTAELYDPATGTWTLTGSLNTARRDATATLLSNGQVLVTGGSTSDSVDDALSSAESYNPATGTWTLTGSLNNPRTQATATLLPNGQVLAAGGENSDGALSSAELYDPTAGTWAPTGSLNTARGDTTATLLPNGQVLVAGGQNSGGAISSAELYEPAAGTWTVTASLNTAREDATATLLSSGQVLVAGGYNDSEGYLSSAELYTIP